MGGEWRLFLVEVSLFGTLASPRLLLDWSDLLKRLI